MKKNSIANLLEVMRNLRDPETGCEWDKNQTSKSLIPFLEEETLEVIEAIKKNDPENLKEELGDLLLQVIFHCEIADEKKLFNFYDVADGLSKKLIRRHPYVFNSKRKHTLEEQEKAWLEIKHQEKYKEK
ncbi:MAG: nucleotide pyrophosphohydrolase [Flavobacteriaceae bacterium]|jgi:MazG family protein|nr:nucleotide pyrophosphohydrolase [Flavobacteriaceae bacterium]|tara:strand:- start:2177 stop:2566 length:390 start_codon:yes stop_codon:yes gene_type:complete